MTHGRPVRFPRMAPLHLHLNRPAHASTFVYVSDAEDGDISGYTMDKASGALTEKGTAALPEAWPTCPATPTALLFSASYGGNQVAVNPVDADGIARSAAIQVVPTGLNAHCIRADRSNRFVYASNLGSNQVLQFLFGAQTGKLTPNQPAAVKARPGNGPRHLTVSPDNKCLYVICELSGNIIQYAIDPKTGPLKELDHVGTVPANAGLLPGAAREPTPVTATSGANTTAAGDDGKPKIWAADIQITPNGRFVYASERTKGLIALLTAAPKTGN